jgi:hypothetical protein
MAEMFVLKITVILEVSKIRAGDIAQVVQHQPSKHKVMTLKPSTTLLTKKKKRENLPKYT